MISSLISPPRFQVSLLLGPSLLLAVSIEHCSFSLYHLVMSEVVGVCVKERVYLASDHSVHFLTIQFNDGVTWCPKCDFTAAGLILAKCIC